MAVCVVLVAGGIGYTAYKVVRDSEQEQFMQNYSQLIKQLKPATNNGTDPHAHKTLYTANVC